MSSPNYELTPLARCEAAWAANTTPEAKWAAIMLIYAECALLDRQDVVMVGPGHLIARDWEGVEWWKHVSFHSDGTRVA
jgi:hypothetical protein